DTEALPGWLENGLKPFDDEGVGIVGSKLIYPDQTVQHAGIEFRRIENNAFELWPVHRLRNLAQDSPEVNRGMEPHAVTGACLFIPRALFLEVDGFSDEYPMYFEDLDLNCKVRALGKRIIYEPRSCLIHFEGKSSPSQRKIDELNVQSARMFFPKWRHLIVGLLKSSEVAAVDPQKSSICSKGSLPKPPVDFLTRRSPTPESPLLVWNAPIFDPSGYADEARHLIKLVSRRWPVRIEPVGRSSKDFAAGMDRAEVESFLSLMRAPLKGDYFRIVQLPGHAFRRDPGAIFNIGRTVFETDRLPSDWVSHCNAMDEVWVPTEFNVQTFQKAGVRAPLHVVPEGIDAGFFHPDAAPLDIPGRRRFMFLSVFEWIHRKGWDLLLRSWAESFSSEEDVCLVLRTYPVNAIDTPSPQIEIERRIDHFFRTALGRAREEVAPIIVLGRQVPQVVMPGLYSAADAFVLPSRGEGWGRPYMEAMACGLPVLGTRWGGNLAFMNDNNSFMID
ncbi:MAG: glycosyltransferase, partial [Syntrophobacteraceae bacterium]|nr:glycosyltransferase [Syntrophobacteraceae bacterium]